MTPKRGNNEGSISQRADGRYVARLTVDGKRVSYYGRTRDEVRAKLTTALADVQRGTFVAPSQQSVAEFLASWLQDVAQPNVRPRTALRYEQFVRIQIAPHIGSVRLTKLTPQHLVRLYRTLSTDLSPRSVNHVHRCLHSALETAVRWGIVARNVCDLVDPPRVPRVEMRSLSLEQSRALLLAAQGDPLEALYSLALTTGMRQGELLGLKWQDVDLASGRVQVRRTLARVTGKGWVESEPKSAAGTRTVRLVSPVVSALQRHRSAQLEGRLRAGSEWDDRDLVFCNLFGRPIEITNLTTRSFRPLLERAGLPQIRFHDLRHSAASLLLLLDSHPRIVQEVLGHSSVNLTLGTYSHVQRGLHDDALDKLGDALFDVQ